MTTTSLKERIKAKTAVKIEPGPLDAAQPCLLGDKLKAKVASALEKERDALRSELDTLSGHVAHQDRTIAAQAAQLTATQIQLSASRAENASLRSDLHETEKLLSRRLKEVEGQLISLEELHRKEKERLREELYAVNRVAEVHKAELRSRVAFADGIRVQRPQP